MAFGFLLWLVTKKRIPPYYSASKAVSSSNQVLFTMRAILSLTFMILSSSMSWAESFTRVVGATMWHQSPSRLIEQVLSLGAENEHRTSRIEGLDHRDSGSFCQDPILVASF